MKQPQIGHIVHYEDGVYGTCAAIIANLYDDGSALLAIFHKTPPGPEGRLGSAISPLIYHQAEYSEEPKVNHWSWPKGEIKR